MAITAVVKIAASGLCKLQLILDEDCTDPSTLIAGQVIALHT